MSAFRVPFQAADSEFVEKRSRFISHIWPVETEEQAQQCIKDMKAKYYDARHNCWCYRIGPTTARYSDDGEPQGTAGVPVFEVLRKEGLTDVCCVVTRYFGGILLGGGGLVRAYSHSAKIAVDAAERKKMCSCYPMEITSDYGLYGKIVNILPEFEVKITDTVFETDVTVKLLCRSALTDALTEKLIDTANGKITVHKGEEGFENFT